MVDHCEPADVSFHKDLRETAARRALLGSAIDHALFLIVIVPSGRCNNAGGHEAVSVYSCLLFSITHRLALQGLALRALKACTYNAISALTFLRTSAPS